MKHYWLVLVLACGSSEREPPSTTSSSSAASATGAADPWAAQDRPATQPGPAAKNLNKLVIGGDNTKPQMGLFALTARDAEQVDAAMDSDGSEPAYRLAQKLAVKAWAGDRTFCEDSVRLRLGYFGIDGGLDEDKRDRYKNAKLADLREKHGKAINSLHEKMIGERDEAACDRSLAMYAEALQLASTKQLELRNFGY